jgi:hypothetical protein
MSNNLSHQIKLLYIKLAPGIVGEFCPTMTENKCDLMPYFPRIKEMDQVGFGCTVLFP